MTDAQIISHDLSVLNLVIVKKGEKDLPGLTDTEKPRMRGPKRASKTRKLFNLTKDDDVRKYKGKEVSKAPRSRGCDSFDTLDFLSRLKEQRDLRSECLAK
ncbi:hypothetical protein N665_1354s0020 [Sinapis alba]|nr:hypothetical protein N665_1354s0020 [Sinapis alba]